MHPSASLYKRHRFSAEIISHCVWLYHRFGLSLRDVQELMAERGIAVTYETVHQWCRKFGPPFAQALRRRRPHPGEKWHIDEVQLKMNGRRYWLWRAVDQHGMVLDILVQAWRNRNAAETFLRQVAARSPDPGVGIEQPRRAGAARRVTGRGGRPHARASQAATAAGSVGSW